MTEGRDGSAPAQNRLLVIAYATFLLVGWSTLLVPALIRLVERDFVQTDAGLGLFYLVSALFFGVGSLGGGFATERVGRRPILAGAALLMGAGLLVQGAAPGWWLFLAGAVPVGIGSGAVDGGMNALVLDLSRRRPGSALNRLHLFFSIGAAGSPLLVGQLVGIGVDWRIIVLATALPAVAIGAALALHVMPSGRHAPVAPVPHLAAGSSPVPPGRSIAPFVALAFAIGLYVSAEVGVSSWVVRFLASAPNEAATATLAAFWAGLAISRLVASRFADRFPPVVFATTCVLVAAAALLGAVAVPWVGLAMVLFAVTGLAFGPVYPMIMSIGGSRYPRRLAAVTGSLAAAAVAGSVVYPPLMGFISETAGLTIGMAGTGILAMGCAVALAGAGRATRRPA